MIDLVQLFSTIVGTLLALVSYLVFSAYQDATYFKSKKTPYLGNSTYQSFFMSLKGITMLDNMIDCYKTLQQKNQRFAAGREFKTRTFFLTDLSLIKQVMVKDFDHFVDRRVFGSEKSDPVLSRMLISITGDRWKALRSGMIPIFTSGKIRRMFQIFNNSGIKFVDFIQNQSKGLESFEINLQDVYAKYTMDILANAAFGVESQAFDQKRSSLFQKMGEKLKLKTNLLCVLKSTILTMTPWLGDFLGLSVLPKNAQDYFEAIVNKNLEYREETKERRDDFIQLMLDVREGRVRTEDGEWGDFEREAVIKGQRVNGQLKIRQNLTLEDEDIVSQCALFILQGYETTMALHLFTVYNLALYPELQKRVFEEVEKAWSKSGCEELTYDMVNELEYLDMFINETLRLCPPVIQAERTCTKDFQIPDSEVVIKKGNTVYIPIFALHKDANYFPDPEKFNPERFSSKHRSKISQFAFMPFGHGPRNCIGMRLAIAKVKVAIAHLLHNFILETSKKTRIPMRFANTSGVGPLKPQSGLWLKLHTRK